MTGMEFLTELFSITGNNKQVVIRQVPPKASTTHDPHNFSALKNLSKKSNWWFGVCPRPSGSQKPSSAVTIWADIDNVDEVPKLQALLAPPSAIVSSGHGFHLYWFLQQEEHLADAHRLVKLARLAFDADHQAVEPARLLRIPGTTNVKYDPHMPCEVVQMSGRRYELLDLEEKLVTAWLSHHWLDGQRNEVVQGMALIGARAGWSEDKTIELVRTVCKATKDKEVTNRVANVKLTYAKWENGQAVGMNGLVDILGTKETKQLLDCLGYDSRDGDLKFRDSVFGTAQTALQDIVRLFAKDECEWGYTQGQVVHWRGEKWVPIEKQTLASQIFRYMDEMILVKEGREVKRSNRPGEAEGIAKMVYGSLAENPMKDTPTHLLPLANGILDLRTGYLRSATMEDNVQVCLPVAYEEDADCPHWLAFLDEQAPKTKKFLQEFVGYALLPGNFFQRMCWVYGEANTGKSTFLNVVYKMFGETAATLSSQNIGQYHLAALQSARLAVCTELTTQRFRTAVFKALVSGDPVAARHPYGRPFSVEFKGKLMFGSNNLPTLDETEGVMRRLALVPFDNMPKKVDYQLGEKLLKELPGILLWALDGLRRVEQYMVDRSWPLPASVTETVTRYNMLSNPIDIFMSEEIEFDLINTCSIRELFMKYSSFSKDLGQPTREMGAWFIEEFIRRGCKVDDGRKIVGAKVKEFGMTWKNQQAKS